MPSKGSSPEWLPWYTQCYTLNPIKFRDLFIDILRTTIPNVSLVACFVLYYQQYLMFKRKETPFFFFRTTKKGEWSQYIIAELDMNHIFNESMLLQWTSKKTRQNSLRMINIIQTVIHFHINDDMYCECSCGTDKHNFGHNLTSWFWLNQVAQGWPLALEKSLFPLLLGIYIYKKTINNFISQQYTKLGVFSIFFHQHESF